MSTDADVIVVGAGIAGLSAADRLAAADTSVLVVEPVTESQARLARQAYADFGKGSGHPAGLNFGDCLSYALALDLREPLLWKGDDFGRTGIQSALGD